MKSLYHQGNTVVGPHPLRPKSWSSTLPARAYPPSHPIGGRCLHCYLESRNCPTNTLVQSGEDMVHWLFTANHQENLITWDLPLRCLFGLARHRNNRGWFVWSYQNVNSMRLTYHKHSCIKEKCNMTYTDTVPLWACYRDRKNKHTTAYFSKLGRSVEVNTCTHWRIPSIYTLKVSKQNQTSVHELELK